MSHQIKCLICGKSCNKITFYHLQKHNLKSTKEYVDFCKSVLQAKEVPLSSDTYKQSKRDDGRKLWGFSKESGKINIPKRLDVLNKLQAPHIRVKRSEAIKRFYKKTVQVIDVNKELPHGQ